MIKTNIKVEKTFIDAWQTSINNAIYIKIIKDISLIVTFVSVKSSTKKNIAFYINVDIFKKIDINCMHIFASETIKTIMIVWNDLTEWMKTCALFNFKINIIVKFI